MKFEELNLAPELLAALTTCGYTEPTPIQAQAIPHLLAGRDLIGSAQTGTGKTAAFVLPALQRLAASGTRAGAGRNGVATPRILVLAPTRELAQQVAEQAVRYGRSLKVNTVCIYGGAPYPIQNRELARGADIIVATPGRLIDHLERGRIDLSALEVLVLDEADRMLDMGFVDDVERIALLAPKSRQTVLFSATFDGAIARLSARLMRDAVRIEVQADKAAPVAIEQRVHFADDHSHKHRILDHLLADVAMTQSIVFIATKRDAESLAQRLKGEGHAAAALHGDMNQHERTRTLLRHAPRPRAHARRDGCRRARHRRRRHQPRDQLRPAAAGRGLRPPDRPHGSGRCDGHRRVDRESRRTRRGAPDRALHGRRHSGARNPGIGAAPARVPRCSADGVRQAGVPWCRGAGPRAAGAALG